MFKKGSANLHPPTWVTSFFANHSYYKIINISTKTKEKPILQYGLRIFSPRLGQRGDKE